ncbi:Condensin [Entamoeba marina]
MEFEIPQTDFEITRGFAGNLDCSIQYDFSNDAHHSELKKKVQRLISQVSENPLLLYDKPNVYGLIHVGIHYKVVSDSFSKVVQTLLKYDFTKFTTEMTRKYRSTLKMVVYLLSLLPVSQTILKGMYEVLKLPIQSIFQTPDPFFLDVIRKIATQGIGKIDTEQLNPIFLKLSQLNHVDAIVTGILQMLSDDCDVVSICNSILLNNDPVVQKFLRQVPNVDFSNPKLQKNFSSLLPLLPTIAPESKKRLPSLLHSLLDQQEHIIRNGVIECYAEILLDTPNDQLFDCLIERLHDVNSFVRVKTLQMWEMLVQKRAVPLTRFNNLTKCSIERLNDKSTPVRKNSIALLQSILIFNPYSVNLRRDLFESKLQDTADMLKETVKENEDEFSVPINRIIEIFEGTGFQHVADTELLEAKKQEVLKTFVEWLKNSIEFIDIFEESIGIIEGILTSTTVLDLKEAIRFFGTICQYKIPKGSSAMKKTFELLFAKDVDVQNVIVDAFSKALCNESPQNTTNNLLVMTHGSNIGEEICLQKLVALLIQKNVIGQMEIDYLWAYLAGKLPTGGEMEAITALKVLSFVGGEIPYSIIPKLPLLSSVCFNKDAKPQYLYGGCQVLLRMYEGSVIKKGDSISQIQATDPTVKRLIECLDCPFNPNTWIAILQIVLDVVYKAVTHPNEVGREIIRRRALEVSNSKKVSNVIRLLSAVGGVARKQGELYESMKEDVAGEVEKKKGKKGKRISEAVSNRMQEVVGEVLEDGLLGEFIPIVDDYVNDIINGKYQEDVFLTFRVVVFNTMCSFMLVSQQYCSSHLQSLFTVLENTEDECIRSNIVYYVGDYSCRYPNLLEGWIPHLYSRLKDPSALVRRSSVIVLSELIFHDIVKVKGSLYLMGLALVDEEERVRDLAHTFFHEYSSKTNAIYNALPDLISSLGNEDIIKENFEYITQYVFSFIAKDKQHEQLMKKLCARFTMNEQTTKQWGCTAYCLSLLNYNEKTLKQLIESTKSFGNKLHITEVKDAFISLTQRLRKFAKPEFKSLVDKLEKIVLEEAGDDADVDQIIPMQEDDD